MLQIDFLTEGEVNKQPLRLRGTGKGDPDTGLLTIELTADDPWPDGGFDLRIVAIRAGTPIQIFFAPGDGDVPGFAELTGGAYQLDRAERTTLRTRRDDLLADLTVCGKITRRGGVVVCRQRISGSMRLPSPLAEVMGGAGRLLPRGPGRATADVGATVILVDGKELELHSDVPFRWANQQELPALAEYVIEAEELAWSGRVLTRRTQAALRRIGAAVPA